MKRWLAYELAKNDHTRVGFWPLLNNERDYSGRGNHGTPVNTALVRQGGKNGYRVAAPGYDGAISPEYLSLGNCKDLAFDNNQSWSVSTWFFRESQAALCNLLSFTGPTVNSSWAGWAFDFDTNYLNVQITCTTNYANNETVQGNAYFGNTLQSFQAFGWYHLVVTYNGNGNASGFHIYVNGVRIPITWSQTAIVGSWIPPTLSQAKGYIGNGPLINNDDKSIGIVRIAQAWKRELSAAEVVQRYQREAAVDTFGRTEAQKEFILYLFIHGHMPDSTTINLFAGYGGPSASIPLFLNSAQPVDTEPGLPLYLGGFQAISTIGDVITQGYNSSLMILQGYGLDPLSYVPLYVQNIGPASGSLPLFVQNTTVATTTTMNLFMDASPAGTPSLTTDLFVMGTSGDTGYAKYIPLFLEVGASGSDWSSQMNLFTKGIDQGAISSNMNLFTFGGTTQKNNSLPLYLWNSQSGEIAAMPLTCWAGPTGDPGSYAWTGSMNLFIDRPTDAYAPLFIHGDLPASSSINLFVHGNDWLPGPGTEIEQGLTGNQFVTQGYGNSPPGLNLVLPNVWASSVYPDVPFFIHGY